MRLVRIAAAAPILLFALLIMSLGLVALKSETTTELLRLVTTLLGLNGALLLAALALAWWRPCTAALRAAQFALAGIMTTFILSSLNGLYAGPVSAWAVLPVIAVAGGCFFLIGYINRTSPKPASSISNNPH